MKNFKRMSLGIITTLLLTAGLARAAQQLDPLTNSLTPSTSAKTDLAPASGCALPCMFDATSPASGCALPCMFDKE